MVGEREGLTVINLWDCKYVTGFRVPQVAGLSDKKWPLGGTSACTTTRVWPVTARDPRPARCSPARKRRAPCPSVRPPACRCCRANAAPDASVSEPDRVFFFLNKSYVRNEIHSDSYLRLIIITYYVLLLSLSI